MKFSGFSQKGKKVFIILKAWKKLAFHQEFKYSKFKKSFCKRLKTFPSWYAFFENVQKFTVMLLRQDLKMH